MIRVRLIPKLMQDGNKHCNIIDERPVRDNQEALVAAEAMLSAIDYLCGASSHEVWVHRCDDRGGHYDEPIYVATS